MAGATFGQLQTRVSKRLIDPTNVAVSAADVAQAINDSFSFWKNEKYWFNFKSSKITLDITPAADGSLTSDPFILRYGNTNPLFPNAPVLPSNFLFEDEQDGFIINYSNTTYQIDKCAPQQYDNAFSSNGNGIPYIYCFRNGNYEIYWLPQTAYSCSVNYYADYPDLVNTSDTNDFTTFADKLIEYDAISRLLSDLRLDDERAAKFAARAAMEDDNLKSRSRKQKATGRLVVDTILQS